MALRFSPARGSSSIAMSAIDPSLQQAFDDMVEVSAATVRSDISQSFAVGAKNQARDNIGIKTFAATDFSAVPDDSTDNATALQTTGNYSDGLGDKIWFSPGKYRLGTAQTYAGGPVFYEGVGSGQGPGVINSSLGSILKPTFTTGDVITARNAYGSKFKDLQFRPVTTRTTGAFIHIKGPNTSAGDAQTAENGRSIIDGVSAVFGYDGIKLTGVFWPFVTNCSIGGLNNGMTGRGITANSDYLRESSGGTWFNNNVWCDAAAVANYEARCGYVNILANHSLSAIAGYKFVADGTAAGRYGAFFNVTENFVNYGQRWENVALQTGAQCLSLGNEYFNDINSPTDAKAQFSIAANSTPGSTWLHNAIVGLDVMRGSMTRSSGGPASNSHAAYYDLDGVNGLTLLPSIISRTGADSAVGIHVGADARNVLILHPQFLDEGSSATGKKYNGTFTYTQIDDMPGCLFADLPSAANGSRIFVTDGTVTATQTLAGSGAGVWAFRINGGWVPLGITYGKAQPANGGTGIDTSGSTGIPYIVGGTWTVVSGVASAYLSSSVSGVNFNSANTDNAITISLPSGKTRYMINGIRISGASASLTTATYGVFTAAAAGGTAIVTSASAITVNTASENTNNNAMASTLNNSLTESYNAATLYFRVQTAQGSAATGSVSIFYSPLP